MSITDEGAPLMGDKDKKNHAHHEGGHHHKDHGGDQDHPHHKHHHELDSPSDVAEAQLGQAMSLEEFHAQQQNGLTQKRYNHEMKMLDIELVQLQRWVVETKARVVVIFEGRDAAGKGGVIKRVTEPLNPRFCRVAALGTPTEKEKTQWYFQRYVAHLPAGGEMVLFDRSWYNRAGVEHVMGFCTEDEYRGFLKDCPDFEAMLIRSGIYLIKFWFSVSDEEQEKRFKERATNPLKQWKLSPMDIKAREYWVDYSKAKDRMFAATDTDIAPWYVVNADNKEKARLNCIRHLLGLIPYVSKPYQPIDLPPRPSTSDHYVRPPLSLQKFVPDYYE
jgi:polyphosphate kinase 2